MLAFPIHDTCHQLILESWKSMSDGKDPVFSRKRERWAEE
jgi:hypothetical protein